MTSLKVWFQLLVSALYCEIPDSFLLYYKFSETVTSELYNGFVDLNFV